MGFPGWDRELSMASPGLKGRTVILCPDSEGWPWECTSHTGSNSWYLVSRSEPRGVKWTVQGSGLAAMILISLLNSRASLQLSPHPLS